MKSRHLLLPSLVTASLAGPAILPGLAQWEEDDPTLDRNRIVVNARFAFNISAEVRTLDTPAANLPPLYNDGYVLADINGGADGKTWNWGYQNAAQIVGDNLNLHYTTGSPLNGTAQSLDGDLQAGFEVVYGRVLGFFNLSRTRKAAWGVEGGFSSLDINLDADSSAEGSITRHTDLYSLGGVVPPQAPYAGTFAGPGPAISLNPFASSAASLPASSAWGSKIDSLLLGFKVGPFLELPLSRRFAVELNAGIAVMDAINSFSFTETTLLAGVPGGPPTRTEEYDQSEWLFGFYGSASVSFKLNYSLSLFLGAQYQNLGDVSIEGGGKAAVLQLGETFELLAGLRASF